MGIVRVYFYKYFKLSYIELRLFKTFDYPVLYAKSTQGILFQGNKIERTYTTDRLSGNENSFYFNGCKDVELKANQWTGWENSPIIKMENMHKKSLSCDF